MKALVYTDVHFSEYSSIIRSEGNNYSTRLENLIKSINWAENQAIENNCDKVYILGDFFDRPDLNAKELTALQEIKWANLPHICLVGNHESGVKSLKYNSVMALQKQGFTIIDHPTKDSGDTYDILLLPYILEDDRKSLADYWKDVGDSTKTKIIFSHNDIKGLNYGMIISKDGFDIKEIESECKLFLNGHLHNGTKFCKNGFNLGNLTGQNFGEDATKYNHPAFILDTSDNSLIDLENPYAFNFYKIEINSEKDIEQLDKLKNNAVVSIKCKEELITIIKNKLESLNLIASKILIQTDSHVGSSDIEELHAVNHLDQFVEFALSKLGESELLKDELAHIVQ